MKKTILLFLVLSINFLQSGTGKASKDIFMFDSSPEINNSPSKETTSRPDTPPLDEGQPIAAQTHTIIPQPQEEFTNLMVELRTGRDSVLRIAHVANFDLFDIYRGFLIDPNLRTCFELGRRNAPTRWRYMTDGHKMDAVVERALKVANGTASRSDKSLYTNKSLNELLKRCIKEDLFKRRPLFKEFIDMLNLPQQLNNYDVEPIWTTTHYHQQPPIQEVKEAETMKPRATPNEEELQHLLSALTTGETVAQIAQDFHLEELQLYQMISESPELVTSFKIGRSKQPTEWPRMTDYQAKDAIFEGTLDNLSDSKLRTKLGLKSDGPWYAFLRSATAKKFDQFRRMLKDKVQEQYKSEKGQTTQSGKRPHQDIANGNEDDPQSKKRKTSNLSPTSRPPQQVTAAMLLGNSFVKGE